MGFFRGGATGAGAGLEDFPFIEGSLSDSSVLCETFEDRQRGNVE
jgi:hypothetical protein